MSLRETFESNLELIEETCASVCRRNGCFGADAEDFASLVKLKLIEDDYARLGKFRGRSSLRTFLTAVIANLFRDFRIHKWGRWRPSAAARRRGATAIRLESLLYRDGYSLDEAIGHLKLNFREAAPPLELRTLAEELPARSTRRFESDERLLELAAAGGAEDGVLERERAETAERARAALDRALSALGAEDRLILKLRFADGFTVARIAQLLPIHQRRLYSRIERSLRNLRRSLEGAGLRAEEVLDTIGWEGIR